MAKSSEKPETTPQDAKSSPPADAGSPKAAQPAPQQAQQLVVDAGKAQAAYSNFCRVTGTPEELIIDFGLNAQPMGVPTEPIAISQRIVVNYFTAKRLLAALHMSLERHESAFGILETDVQKRVRPGVMRTPAPAR